MDFIGSRKLILSVGRLVPYKGFEVLIEAASSISADCAIVVVGTGPLRESLAEQIRARGLENKVLLAGRQEDNILAGLFSMARLFCLPSIERSEAFGVVLVEAMAYGLPIVATDIIGSGVPWVNAHLVSGLNVRPGDATALAASCNRILSSDELHAALSMGSRHRFENEFTDTLAVERTLSLYNRLVLRK
jgi:glycosyltransferase involved in cell wall biosynthesis